MNEWYIINWWEEYYCSEDCPHNHIPKEEYTALYDEWNSDTCFTEWDEDEEDAISSIYMTDDMMETLYIMEQEDCWTRLMYSVFRNNIFYRGYFASPELAEDFILSIKS